MNIRHETKLLEENIKLLEENMKGNLLDIGLGDEKCKKKKVRTHYIKKASAQQRKPSTK